MKNEIESHIASVLEERDRIIHSSVAKAELVNQNNLRFVALGIAYEHVGKITESLGKLIKILIPHLENYTGITLEPDLLTFFVVERRVPIPGISESLTGKSYSQKLPSSLGGGRGILLLGPPLSSFTLAEELTHQYMHEIEKGETGGKLIVPPTLNEGFTNYLAGRILSTIEGQKLLTPNFSYFVKLALNELKETVLRRNPQKIYEFICSFIDYPLSESLFSFAVQRFEEDEEQEKTDIKLYKEIIKITKIFKAIKGYKTPPVRPPEDLPSISREQGTYVILDILGIKNGDTDSINKALANSDLPLEKRLIVWLYLQQSRALGHKLAKTSNFSTMMNAAIGERKMAGAIFDKALGRCFGLNEQEKARFYREWALNLLKKT